MGEPSNNIDPQILAHLHLVVTKRFGQPRGLDDVVNCLSMAPQLIQHSSTVEWRFLETPRDGEVMLVCQSSQLGAHFPSDGYVWAGVEETMRKDVRGQILEIYSFKAGYMPEREPFTAHARVRYRLRSQPHQQVDESIWLVCYKPAEPHHRISTRSVPITPQIRHTMSVRAELGRNKMNLLRKEFMRSDRDNWPRIGLPGAQNNFGQQSVAQQGMQSNQYPLNLIGNTNRGQLAPNMLHQQQQQQQLQQRHAMMGQAGLGPSPSKRPRTGTGTEVPGPVSITKVPGPVIAQQNVANELAKVEPAEVGIDYMDTLTPREISIARYVQHHEWLEEVLSSPYDTRQIIPPQLGLGRKGELESLTADFFDAPAGPPSALRQDPSSETAKGESIGKPANEHESIPRVGRLAGTKATEFTEKANHRLAELNAEMEVMQKQHAKRMAKLNKIQFYKEAEHNLRMATLDLVKGNGKVKVPEQVKNVDELTMSVEQREGKGIQVTDSVVCLQKGGQEDLLVAPSADEIIQDYEMTGHLDLSDVKVPLTSEDSMQADGHIMPPNAATPDLGEHRSPPAASSYSAQTTATYPEHDYTGTGNGTQGQALSAAPRDALAAGHPLVGPESASALQSSALAENQTQYMSLQPGENIMQGNGLEEFDVGPDADFEADAFGDTHLFDTAGATTDNIEHANHELGARSDQAIDSSSLHVQTSNDGETRAP